MSEEIKALLLRKERRIGELEREYEQAADRVEKLESEIEELKQENIGLKNEVASLDATLENEITDGREREARIGNLVKALEWYANKENWRTDLERKWILCGEFLKPEWGPIARDSNGERARQALAEYRSGEGDEHGA